MSHFLSQTTSYYTKASSRISKLYKRPLEKFVFLIIWLLFGFSVGLTGCSDSQQAVDLTHHVNTHKIDQAGQKPDLKAIAKIDAKALAGNNKSTLVKHHFFQEIMGTHFQVQLIAIDRQTALSVVRASFNEARRIEHLMSSWRKESEIGQINAFAGKKQITVSYETTWLLCKAKQLSTLTRGSFDITWASLKGLWNFKTQQIPKHETLLSRLKAVGSNKYIALTIKDQQGMDRSCEELLSLSNPHPIWTRFESQPPVEWNWTFKAQLTNAQSQIDLGGIAKGFAIDSMARLIKHLGYTDFIVDGGGDLLVIGRDQNQEPWQVGIQHPRHDQLWGSLWVPSGWSVVTSGDYERFFYHNEQRYHHIIDLRTGYPAQGSVAMTVIAENALMADVLATALFILGPYEGIALADSISGVEALCFTPSGEVIFTHGAQVFSPNLTNRWK